jgi:hypothetical protein
MVGAVGFEPTTCGTQNRRAPGLRYAPMMVGLPDRSRTCISLFKAPPDP